MLIVIVRTKPPFLKYGELENSGSSLCSVKVLRRFVPFHVKLPASNYSCFSYYLFICRELAFDNLKIVPCYCAPKHMLPDKCFMEKTEFFPSSDCLRKQNLFCSLMSLQPCTFLKQCCFKVNANSSPY